MIVPKVKYIIFQLTKLFKDSIMKLRKFNVLFCLSKTFKRLLFIYDCLRSKLLFLFQIYNYKNEKGGLISISYQPKPFSNFLTINVHIFSCMIFFYLLTFPTIYYPHFSIDSQIYSHRFLAYLLHVELCIDKHL